MSESYSHIAELHRTLPAFSPYVPATALPYLAFFLLLGTFILGFYFTTLPKDTIPIREVSVASAASILAGFGVVSLFCSSGVNV
ncbi:hypothetical protein SISSUDRAFT_1058284 [Sistotremastrum suecicum HHB10207 ss-3]|uniref:Dolichyl-diphosphooligosaccharide-protein glycosyltransferase subunit OST5 n=1 Tax=Sistotremastrum suecicum HHB10207 ss-3 TaxID=1314776 RepID=A0A166HKW5_9AGAM|nr:hypothetical protein SISSUDRAFT_1058284 [Sistotremastrum suecicum HHB10207 ss-3]